MTDRADLEKLISDAKRVAKFRKPATLVYLLESATIEVAILSEQKLAKVIQLLEESRRDNPLVHNRVDEEAEAMAQPADPQSVFVAIKETDAGNRGT
jgi:hypothetical protein